jgi:hypothetical protein
MTCTFGILSLLFENMEFFAYCPMEGGMFSKCDMEYGIFSFNNF